MGPPHIALFVVINDNPYRYFESKPFLGNEGVVLEQPIGQFLVEWGPVVKQHVLVVVGRIVPGWCG